MVAQSLGGDSDFRPADELALPWGSPQISDLAPRMNNLLVLASSPSSQKRSCTQCEHVYGSHAISFYLVTMGFLKRI